MPTVKSLDRISAKWARVAAVSQTEYEDGVRNPRRDWAETARASEANYERGVQQSITRKSYGKGIGKAGTGKWQERTLKKGPQRWAEGINLSQSNFEAGFSPYREVIQRTALPQRGPKGDPKNIQRVAALADALHREKLARQGG